MNFDVLVKSNLNHCNGLRPDDSPYTYTFLLLIGIGVVVFIKELEAALQ